MLASSSTLANSTTALASAAPPSFVGATNASTDSGTSLTYSVPAGALVGDLLVAVTSIRSATTISGPAGWTGHTQYGPATITQRVHTNVASSSELTTTHTFTFGATPIKAAGVLLVFRGVGMPFVTSAGQSNASATSIAVPALAMGAQSVMLVIAASKAHSDTHSQAAGFTLNAASTAASGPVGTTANRVSVHYRGSSVADPPGATIAAGTNAAVSVGVQIAIPSGLVVTNAETASPGSVALTGAAATLLTTPHLITLDPDVYEWLAPEASLSYDAPWDTIATLGGFAASYSDTTAAPGTTYRYRVVGVNTLGETPSNEDQVTTISGSTYALTLDPGAATLTGATNGATFATAAITASAGVYVGSGVAATLDNPALVFEVVDTLGVASAYSDFGLTPSTGYVYRIVGVNASGETISNVVVVYTPAATLAEQFVASPGTGSLTGVLASTTLHVPLFADNGDHLVTGAAANLVTVHHLVADSQNYTLETPDTSIVAATRLAALAGAHAMTGAAATLARVWPGQTAVPVADVTDGNWTPSAGVDLYPTIDEQTDDAPVDTDYIRTVTPISDTAVVDLSDLQTPVAGDVQILVRTRTG